MEVLGYTGYIEHMGHPEVKREKKTESVSIMVSATVKQLLQSLMKQHDRSESYVGLQLLLRGIAAFERDGSLYELEPADKPAPLFDYKKASGSRPAAIPPQAQRQQDVSRPHLSVPIEDAPAKNNKDKDDKIKRDIAKATEYVRNHSQGEE